MENQHQKRKLCLIETPQKTKSGARTIADYCYFLPFAQSNQKMPIGQSIKYNQTSSSPFNSYQTPIKKELKSSFFEMVEVPENIRNGS